MKRVIRNPMRFEPFNLLALYGREEGTSLRDSDAREDFLRRITESLDESLQDDALLHGQRTQAMFGSLVASLGSFQLLKMEDSGDVYVMDDSLEIPDYRVVLQDGAKLLIEVKNFYRKPSSSAPFTMKEAYLDGLIRYAQLTDCQLKIAVYWAAWRLWALVPPTAFTKRGNSYQLSMRDAMLANEMRVIGDRWIGTQFPLTIRLFADRDKSSTIGADGEVNFTIGEVKLYCGDRVITDKSEQSIAYYLMLYGGWEEEENVEIEGEELLSIEYAYTPPIPDQSEADDMPLQDSLAIVNPLSTMYAISVDYNTVNEGKIDRLPLGTTPGFLSHLILGEHKGDVLPLFIFDMQPNLPAES